MKLRTRATTYAAPVQQAPAKRDIPEALGERRPCTKPGCITRLNRYHGGDRCYQHEHRRLVPRSAATSELMAEAPGPA